MLAELGLNRGFSPDAPESIPEMSFLRVDGLPKAGINEAGVNGVLFEGAPLLLSDLPPAQSLMFDFRDAAGRAKASLQKFRDDTALALKILVPEFTPRIKSHQEAAVTGAGLMALGALALSAYLRLQPVSSAEAAPVFPRNNSVVVAAGPVAQATPPPSFECPSTVLGYWVGTFTDPTGRMSCNCDLDGHASNCVTLDSRNDGLSEQPVSPTPAKKPEKAATPLSPPTKQPAPPTQPVRPPSTPPFQAESANDDESGAAFRRQVATLNASTETPELPAQVTTLQGQTASWPELSNPVETLKAKGADVKTTAVTKATEIQNIAVPLGIKSLIAWAVGSGGGVCAGLGILGIIAGAIVLKHEN